ncbi:methyl-accepting chemotaxis protein [uncultured Desulfobacter sp.]|uniref:methyl-accepting chemotaxis protein n=1 Tax=uncultured Desulfobacter sp. TaxID=240139 RepID=UPI0029C732BB|nr:methyl-accepting chemotaxis protein [uncultured Desulfobacter sp.]
MNLKRLTIGKQIAVGFGVVLILLLILGTLSFTGVGGIVKNAGEVIDGNKLDGDLAQKEVDHLNWVNQVNALLTDDSVTTLDVETDHRKCGFGKWLFGEGRKQAEELVPDLVPILKAIEEPHKKLHDSAIEISRVFRQPHAGLALALSNRLTEHVQWVGDLGQALASEAGGLYSYQMLLKNQVDQAVSAIETIEKNNRFDTIEARQKRAADMIKGLRFGDGGKDYFFILNKDVKMVMHSASPDLDGSDMISTTDPKGKRLFAEMVKTGLEKGSGFVTYEWNLPGTGQLAPKLSYVKRYNPWGWIVCTGVYLDHKNHALVKRAEEFAQGKPFSTGVEIDPTKCKFGKFLNDPKTKELMNSFPELKTAFSQMHEPHKALHESAAHIESLVNQLKMQEAMETFEQGTKQALEEVRKYFQDAIDAEQALQAGLDTANRIYATQTMPTLEKTQGLLNTLRETARKSIMTDQVMLSAASGTKRNVSIVAAVAMIAGIFLAFFISRGIIVVLSRITAGMGEGADQVAAASGEVSSSSQSMAEGASEQAASIEETSSSMEEMASMTRKNAENAGHADSLMKEANQVVGRANDSMKELTGSMEEISNASTETSKIIKTIDEIAFQTNLLALNAAVEAARAGEAGAGFAVVADEVRNLAMRAAEAAKNTAELIEGTVQKIDSGTELVSSTNEAFGAVAESTRKVGELVAEISEASKEQSNGIEQVNLAITEMDKVVQQNAANAEESASASEEMNAQAEQLREYVGELVMMVSGKKSVSGSTPRQVQYSRPAAGALGHGGQGIKPAAKKQLSEKSREIKPESVIPFDEDDFEDF